MHARILYHFPMSPFSRRARLALALKGVACELRDARAEPRYAGELAASSALGTAPVLMDGGRRLVDSGAILHYLDAAYPEAPALFPADPADRACALEVVALVDGVLNPLVDLGSRYFRLDDHPAWPEVVEERRERMRPVWERLVAVARDEPALAARWDAAAIALYTAIAWLEGLPARAATPTIARILALGVRAPAPLVAWADRHRERPDVRALDT